MFRAILKTRQSANYRWERWIPYAIITYHLIKFTHEHIWVSTEQRTRECVIKFIVEGQILWRQRHYEGWFHHAFRGYLVSHYAIAAPYVVFLTTHTCNTEIKGANESMNVWGLCFVWINSIFWYKRSKVLGLSSYHCARDYWVRGDRIQRQFNGNSYYSDEGQSEGRKEVNNYGASIKAQIQTEYKQTNLFSWKINWVAKESSTC